jgi:hypothetical protein
MSQPKHFNSNMANQRVLWNGLDTYELYQTNLRDHYDDLQRFGWIDKEIIYEFNSHGFRADSFDSDQASVVSLGCSHTFGVGCDYESTWSFLVSSSMGLKNYNLGVGGSSNDTAFRLANYWIPKLMPKVVVFLSTELTRLELHLADGEINNFSVWSDLSGNQFYKHWMSNDINSTMNHAKNVLAIKQICDQNHITFIHESFDDFIYLHVDRARDLQHFGVKTNRKFADQVLSQI